MALGHIGHYEVLERIGQGGMGVVFKARDPRVDRLVALKVLPHERASDPELRARLVREARAEASLSHSNIALCFEINEAAFDPPDLLAPGQPGPYPDRALYLAMEFIPGEDLEQVLAGRPLELKRALDLAIQIAEGLEAAHAAGVIHRDLKPGNIRVTPDGRVKILDFGLSRFILPDGTTRDLQTSFQTSEGRILGTVYYLAPECLQGRPLDARSDLFSFGAILYQLVTGRLAFAGDSVMEVLYSVTNVEPPPLARYASDVPAELERIVHKLLAKDPAHRYQSAHEVRTDLASLRDGHRPPAVPPWRVAAWAALALALLGAGWWAWQRFLAPPRSVAVLPFTNATGDPGIGYLGEGISADVLGALARRTRINVSSQSSTRSFRDPQRDLRAIARELGVHAVLDGALRRDPGGIRLDVELVQGRTGFVLWSGQFPCSRDQVQRAEEAIVHGVAGHLGGGPLRGGGGVAHAATPSPSAYDEYLRAGLSLEDPDDPRGADTALERYNLALALDPDFALAWAGRSRALWKIYNRDREPDALRRAEEAADRAVQLAPDLLEARVARAQIYRATSRYTASIAELEQVLRVNPNWDEAHVQLSASYRQAGDLAAAERSLRRAIELRPDYWRSWNALGALLIKRGDYPGARLAFERIVQLEPEKNRGYEQLAALALLEGRYDRALEAYERLPAPVTDGALASNIGTAYFFTGKLPMAESYYRLAVRLEPQNHVWRENLGDLLLRQGRQDEAHESYREAVRLVGEQLRLDPRNGGLLAQRCLYLSKSGDCAAARAALADAARDLPTDDAEVAHTVARSQALCGGRAQALDAVRRAVALGVAGEMLRSEDEFRSLKGDSAFVRLTAPR
jgi:Flp pilus assembly protein TadD/TolB-like protein